MSRFLLALAFVAIAAPPLAGAQTGSGRAGAGTPPYQVGDRLDAAKAGKAAPSESSRYREVKWDELISPTWNPEAIVKSLNLDMMVDGDPRANAALEKLRQEWDNAPGNAALNGAEVRIAGFVVPLEREGNALREFLLVPYFGACIHVPPPPANQIVHVVSPRPVPNTATMDAVWASGKLTLFPTSTQMGRSSYRLQATHVEPYSPRKP
jgi:uncharacterized protein